jgi:hypothetical protein
VETLTTRLTSALQVSDMDSLTNKLNSTLQMS